MKTYSIYRLGVKKHDFVIEDDDIRRSMSHDNNVSFNVESKDSLDIKIGDYIIEDGSHYTIYDPIDVEESNGVFSYHLVFRSPDYKLKFSIVKDEGATTFPYHGGIKEFVDLVILSLNEDQQEYTAGDIDEGNIIDLEFDNSSCFQALDDICEAANMEWNLTGTSINVKYRIGKDVDIVFEYGKEKGGYSVRLDKVQNTSIVTRLIGKGGTINLPKDYVSPDTPKRLNLGNEILEKNIDKYGKITGVYTNDNIYPRLINKTVLEVTIPEDIEKATSWKLKLDLPFDLSQQYADDKTPLIKFQTGDLTGNEFEIVDNSWNNTDKTLEIIVQEDESDGYKLPNETRQPRVGDVFVLLNIYMPQSYVDEAIDELRTATQEELNKKSEPQYAPTVKVSKRFLTKNGYSLDIGDSITVKVGEHSINTRILAINQSSSSDEINYELGDEILYSYEDNVNNQIEQIQVTLKQLISLEDVRRLFNVLINQWRPLWMDQKLHSYDDVRFKSVTSPLFVFNELTTPEFVSGLLGSGTRLKDNHLELDEITVRKRMNVFELLIQRVRAVGGQLLLSPASIKIESVEELEDGYKCSFNTDEQTIPEPFVLNDQGFHQTFTGKGINRYWRLVTGVGSDYFILSKTDREEGSGIPRAGDEIILLGNRTDKARQSAMMLSAYGSDAPYLDTYDGIDSYDLSGKLLTREGNLTGIVDDVFGQLSGSGFYGKNVFLRGRFAFNSGQDVEEVLEEVKITANEARDYITNTLPALFEEVDARIDGQVESFFENYDPTLTNKPASDWTTGIEKERHLNDTFTNNTTGASWKWVKDGNAYKWIEIADVATVKALAIAGKAQETADGKIRNFITTAEHPTPYPPYDVGDLWNQGDNGDIMCCIVSRVSGNYVASDWVKSNKYTDDAVAIDARNKANEAQASAESAKTSAEEANTAISDMSSDDIISPIEKQALKKEWDAIMSEKSLNDAQADKFNVSRTLYDGAYNDLATFIGGNLSNLTTNWNVSGATLRFTFKAYYDARTTLLNNIAYVAKQQADKAESDAANAQNTADNAMSGLVEANKQITSLDGKYTAQQSDITNLKTTVDAIPGKITQEVSGVIDWTKQYTQDEIANVQFGMVNLLKGSNVELGAQAYAVGSYEYDSKPIKDKEYTLTICYTLGEANSYMRVFINGGDYVITNLITKGDHVVETITFTSPISPSKTLGIFQFPNGTYGSKVHWAVLVEGNKGPSAWVPALSEQGEEAAKDAVDNLQIGSVNLVSRKMLLDMNNTVSNSAIWGQDSDGVYISVLPRDNTTLYSNFKTNTQYVISVIFKGNPSGGEVAWRTNLRVEYTDGTMESVYLTNNSIYKRVDYISKQGKTIARLVWNVANYAQIYSSFIYSLALYEGNKVLTELPVATEDLQGQSNVNLVDGGKEVIVKTGDGYARLVCNIKPNSVYSISTSDIDVLSGNNTSFLVAIVTMDLNTIICTTFFSTTVKTGTMITPNSIDAGQYYLLLYAGPQHSTSWSVKYTEVMLVEGFTPPASYSPSPGDVQKEIDDVNNAVINLGDTINGAFKDGIISEAEAKAIASNINILNAEKADIDAYYNKLYANAYLTGTAKTNLASAKTAYDTAHEKLIDSINTAIADGKTTATEKADVDAKFTAYNNALSAYQTRVGEADKAIQDTIKKVADDAQTSANTAQSAANTAQLTADQAKAGADAANAMLTKWASDEYISPQEKTALRQQKSDIQAEYNGIVTNANRYYISLTSYTTAYNAAISALTKYTATSPENIQVGSDYDNIAAYYTARQTILDSIAAAAKAQADKATGAIGMEGGRMLYKDPEFEVGVNGVNKYTNSSNVAPDYTSSKLTVERVAKPSDAPTQSGYCLKITCKAPQSPGYGGVYQRIHSRANAVFIQKIIAKIPVGYTIASASNSMGTGYSDTWLTSTAGTGKYTTYLRKVVCGTTGNFDTGGHVYIVGSPAPTESDPLEWYIAFMTCYDQTADGYGDIIDTVTTEFNTKIDQKADSVTVTAIRTDLNSLGQVVSQQGSKIDVNTGSIDMIVTKNGSGTIVSIKPEMVEITGATVIKDGNGNKVNIFGVGDKVISVNGGVFSVDKDGKVIMTNAEITGKVTSKTGEIGGMAITDNGIRSIDFNPVTMVGSCYARNGLSVYASGSGILIPSSGLLQASRITAIGDNASIIGMEIVAHNNSGYGSLASVTALKLSAKNDSSTLVKRPVALYVDSGDIVINDGVFCVPVKSTSFYGTSMTFAPSAMIYGINTIGSDNVNVKIANGVSGQILILMNYSGKRFNIVKSDGTLVTRVPAEKSVVLYFDGSNWTGLMIGDFYTT